MRVFVISVLSVLSVFAQGQFPPITDTGVVPFENEGLLGTVGVDFCSPHTVIVDDTSTSVLTLGLAASATAPQFVRFIGNQQGVGNRSRAITATGTVTISGGTLGGVNNYAYVFGYMDSSGVFRFGVIVPTGPTFTTGGTTPVDVTTVNTQLAKTILNTGVYLYAWPMTAGAPATWGASGNQQSQGADCWITGWRAMNTTAGAVSLLGAAGGGPAPAFIPGGDLPANTVVSETYGANYEQGFFLEQGGFFGAGSASAIYVKVKGYRINKPFNPLPPVAR